MGSAVVVLGTGVMLNNEVANFSSPGSPDGLEGGKRVAGNVTPLIVVEGGKPAIVVGAAGSQWIPMGPILTVSNMIDFGMDPAHAIDASRLWEFACCTMELEDWRVPAAVQDDLRNRGHSILSRGEYYWPTVQLATTDLFTGKRFAISVVRGREAGAVGET